MNAKETSKLAVFEGRRIRKTLHEGEWWFSIIDVIEALVGGERPRKYWNDLKKKMHQEGYDPLSEKIGPLRIEVSEKIGRLTTTSPDGMRSLAGTAGNNRRRQA